MGTNTGQTPKKITASKAWKLRVKEKAIKYYLQGNTNLRAVAERISSEDTRYVSHVTVAKYISEALTQWEKQNSELITNYKHAELGRINQLEAEAWDAWLRSQMPERTVMRRKTPVDKEPRRASNKKAPLFLLNEEVETERVTAGNKKFLDTVQWCITKRIEVMASMAIPLADADKPGNITNNTTIRQIVISGRGSQGPAQTVVINE